MVWSQQVSDRDGDDDVHLHPKALFKRARSTRLFYFSSLPEKSLDVLDRIHLLHCGWALCLTFKHIWLCLIFLFTDWLLENLLEETKALEEHPDVTVAEYTIELRYYGCTSLAWFKLHYEPTWILPFRTLIRFLHVSVYMYKEVDDVDTHGTEQKRISLYPYPYFTLNVNKH